MRLVGLRRDGEARRPSTSNTVATNTDPGSTGSTTGVPARYTCGSTVQWRGTGEDHTGIQQRSVTGHNFIFIFFFSYHSLHPHFTLLVPLVLDFVGVALVSHIFPRTLSLSFMSCLLIERFLLFSEKSSVWASSSPRTDLFLVIIYLLDLLAVSWCGLVLASLSLSLSQITEFRYFFNFLRCPLFWTLSSISVCLRKWGEEAGHAYSNFSHEFHGGHLVHVPQYG